MLRGLGYTIFQDGPVIASRINKENSWVDIHRAIVKFFGSAKPGQTLLFYFSGHGIQRRDKIYLAMPEVNTKDPMVEGFSLTRLTELMNSSKSMQIVSIIDACYSGAAVLSTTIRPKAMVAKETANRALAAYDRIIEDIPKAEGRCLLLSSQAYEPSLASDDSYSLYTKYLIEGLRGAKPSNQRGQTYPPSVDDDGNVTPETLHKYVYYKVANEADQVPKIKSDMASNIILAHYPHLAKTKPDTNLMIKEGDEHFLQDEYDKAIECYDRAIEVDPDLVDAWHKKGNALFNKENFDESLKSYDRASLINPNHFDSWYKKGLIYKKKNNHDQAIKCYDRALQIRTNNSNVWYEKGLSLSSLGRYQESIKCYDNAIELYPKHAESWYWKGYAFYEMRMDDEAITCYKRAKEINPDLPGEWYGGGGEPPPPGGYSPPEPTPLQPAEPAIPTRKFRWPIIIAIIVAAVAAVGLILAFAGGSSLFSPTTNSAPVAVAGSDRTVDAGSLVELDGSSSRDPDNNDRITSYRWEQTSGSPQIILNNPTSPAPTFTAPNVTSNTRFSFKLTVTDQEGQSADDDVEITVKPVVSMPAPINNVPRVPASGSIVTDEGKSIRITLTATDADNNDSLMFSIVSPPSHGTLTGVAPNLVYTPQQNYVGTDSFTYRVNDGKATSNIGTITVNIRAVNGPPIADAGVDQIVNSGVTVTLNGTGSRDADGSIRSYLWKQTAGPRVNLVNPLEDLFGGTGSEISLPSFVAPSVTSDTRLEFVLEVTDDKGVTSVPDYVTVTVKSAPTEPFQDLFGGSNQTRSTTTGDRGNQTDGGPLTGITEPFQDLFGGSN